MNKGGHCPGGVLSREGGALLGHWFVRGVLSRVGGLLGCWFEGGVLSREDSILLGCWLCDFLREGGVQLRLLLYQLLWEGGFQFCLLYFILHGINDFLILIEYYFLIKVFIVLRLTELTLWLNVHEHIIVQLLHIVILFLQKINLSFKLTKSLK